MVHGAEVNYEGYASRGVTKVLMDESTALLPLKDPPSSWS